MNRYRFISLILITAMLAGFALPAGIAAAPQRAPSQVNVAGSFEESLGGSNWTNNDALTNLSDANSDGVWKFTATLPTAGNYEYKIVENGDWGTAYPADNVAFTVTAGQEVRWYYDQTDHYVSDSTRQVVAAVAGNFAGAIGGADWSPDNLKTWMKDADGDGIYTFTATIPAGSYEYKVALDEGWAVAYPANNVPFTVPAGGDSVTFSYNSTTHEVSHEIGAPEPPLVVTFPGNWVAAAGLGNDWEPGNTQTQASDANEDGVWKFSATVPAGNYEFKATVGGSWAENYGVNGVADGPNVPFTATGGEVVFYYDRSDNFVASRPNYIIPAVAGNFLSAVGGANWSPDNLKSWMKDPDGDGVYTWTVTVPEGNWEYKVALNEGWSVAYPADNRPFTVPAGGAQVTFYYNNTTHEVWEELAGAVDDEALVAEPVQGAIQDEVMYFVLPDRFANGNTANDQGAAPGGTLAQTGFLATDKSFYHGGDLAGLQGKLDYLAGLGVSSIWLTPVLKNKPTQADSSTSYGIGGAYHGYWILDFESADPHLGTDAELQAFVAEAHDAGIKVFFDMVVNHTADIIDYVGGSSSYRNKEDFPYKDADGVVFDDADYAGGTTFPEMDPATSFPYVPTFNDPGDATAKNPAWLNDPVYYHNRGDSTFSGENSTYGDFFGLDDTFSEQPAVVAGFTAIFKEMIDTYDVDGFRLDTAKHVNIEFWQQLAPEVIAYAQTQGKPDFTMFGEVFDGSAEFMSRYTTAGKLPAVLDFGLQGAVWSVIANGGATNNLANLFAADDYFTDADSNAYQLAGFVSNHDLGRLGYSLRQAMPSAADADLVKRVTWAYAMLYLARGFPVVYYGDEQGFVGGGSDKLSREDMLPSQVPDYMNNDLIGTNATPAQANFDTAHPLYQALSELAELRADNLALRRGAQIQRISSDGPGLFAFSRIEREEQIEYVVAFNSATAAASAAVPVYLANTAYNAIYPAGAANLTSSADGKLTVNLPAAGVAVYKAASALPASAAAPSVTFTTPAAAAGVNGRIEVGVTLSTEQLAEVTFVAKVGNGDWQLVGVDTNKPYRVFFDTSAIAAGTAITFHAIANDLNDHLSSASVSVAVAEPPAPTGPKYAIIHYNRPAGDYGDPTSTNYNDFWGLHLWGDAVATDYQTTWTEPWPFFGEDEYGMFAWIELADASQPVNFIVHRGDVKDPDNSPDRSFNAAQTPEIWLKQGDVAIYSSQAAAQGYVTIRYHRADGQYGDYTSSNFEDFWGLHLWTAQGSLTEWTAPKKADGIDDYGAYFTINAADYPGVLDLGQPLNFIVHRGNDKDPENSPDRSFDLARHATIWLQSGDEAVYTQRGGAEDYALLHYRRPAGDYGDPTSANYADFWGMHVWLDTTNSVQWTSPLRPLEEDAFGLVFKVDLTDNAQQIGYIFHRGDEKDPGPDQFLTFADKGYEVWQLQGADPEDPYILPAPQAGGGSAGNISEQRAYWVLGDTIAWAGAESAAFTYKLCYAPAGGLEATSAGITGGECITLTRDPAGLPQAVKDKMPHIATLPALKIAAADLDLVPEILKGQVALSAMDANGVAQGATGLQIQGVLDDLFTYNGDLGVTWANGVPTLRVWAPTAKSVAFNLYASSRAATPAALPMTYDADSGVWSITGEASWEWQYYLYDVEVWVNSTGAVEHNLVTDPYSFSLSTNSARTQIVDLNDASLKPAGWDTLAKPALPAAEDVTVYELHVRDFSVNDTSVPDALKGTFKAFTLPNSNGVQHLRALQAAGLTHLHLLPTFDIATIDENKANWQMPGFAQLAQYGPASQEQQALIEQTIDQDAFNWGYDPWHYTVPEGSYSTNPDGAQRILEYRGMVQALNGLGLRVVNDVVYNHTNASGQNAKSVLDRIVPGYYHRLNDRGQVETSTCCQNTATEFNMMEKLMIDSVLVWATEYKVDAFRFDLMGHHMKRNMTKLRADLDALTVAADGVNGQQIYVYGEGWNFGEVVDNARGVNATQANMAGTGIGTFSDRLRDAVRGGGPFDGGQDLIRRQGFANGQYYDPNALNSGSATELQELLHATDLVKLGMAGNLAAFPLVDRTGATITGAQLDYNGQPAGYTADPQEQIIYISKHDNQTLYDINAYKMPVDSSMAERVRAQVVGLSTVLLGQGVPFLHAGVDLLRSKSMDRDSYNSGDWFNRIDWTYQNTAWGSGLPRAGVNQDNWPLMQPLLADAALKPGSGDISQTTAMVQELLALRYSSPLFRLPTGQAVIDQVSFLNNGPDQLPGLIVMVLSDNGAGDLDPALEKIVVLVNANDTAQTFTDAAFAGADLALHPIQATGVDAVVKTASFSAATGTFTVPARTTAVFSDMQLVSRSRRFNVDRDTFISGVQPATYFGNAQTMWTGFFGQMRPLVHAPVETLPTNAYVDAAYLYLYITEGRGFTNWQNSVVGVQVHPVTTAWMPVAVNWSSPWSMAGGDYGPALSSNHIGSGKLNTWLRLDVTDAVRDIARGMPNNGFIITNSDATGVRYGLATKEYFDASKTGYVRVYFRTAP
ncbi:MAG: pullulanase-type alpha-1,6-glucosidase [Caldilineales bacterium]